MKSLLLASWLAPGVIAQAAPDNGWGLVAAYGAAAPFAMLCLWVMNRKDQELKILRDEISAVTKVGMEQVVPALVRSTDTLADAAKVLEGATVMMHTLASRGVDPEEIARFSRLLRKVERRLDDGG